MRRAITDHAVHFQACRKPRHKSHRRETDSTLSRLKSNRPVRITGETDTATVSGGTRPIHSPHPA